jgi:hypothetical protein
MPAITVNKPAKTAAPLPSAPVGHAVGSPSLTLESNSSRNLIDRLREFPEVDKHVPLPQVRPFSVLFLVQALCNCSCRAEVANDSGNVILSWDWDLKTCSITNRVNVQLIRLSWLIGQMSGY